MTARAPATNRMRGPSTSIVRWTMLFSGFLFWGLGLSLFVRADLGLGPWDAFHQGLGQQLGITIGTASVVTGVGLLVLWIPLRERPGWGTLFNALCIGPAMDFGLWLLPPVEELALRWAMLVAALLLIGLGSALYLPPGLGAGPRDGLMLGFSRRFGWSVRRSRTLIEASALLIGFLMGGRVGLGTIVFALGVGPVVQVSLNISRRHLPHW